MQKNHDIIRNRTGAFDEAIKAIKLMQENGFFVGVATTLLDINFDDLEEMYQLFNYLAMFTQVECCAVKFIDLENPIACTYTTTNNVAQTNTTHNLNNSHDSTDAED